MRKILYNTRLVPSEENEGDVGVMILGPSHREPDGNGRIEVNCARGTSSFPISAQSLADLAEQMEDPGQFDDLPPEVSLGTRRERG